MVLPPFDNFPEGIVGRVEIQPVIRLYEIQKAAMQAFKLRRH